jgi:putative pyruvate formate lyase activating enzyme
MSPALERYRAIVEGRSNARYLLTRSVAMGADAGPSLSERWKAHDGKMGEYRDLVTTNASPRTMENSLLDLKKGIADELLKACCFCEHDCRVDRGKGIKGRCGVLEPRVASQFVHMGEEEPLVPSYTIFFSGCNMQCVFCQNYDISTRLDCGSKIPAEDMALHIEGMAERRGEGRTSIVRELRIRNVNWVGGDPTPNLPYFLEVLGHSLANLAQVWNSNMYMSEKAMALLDGTVDVYLTDLKYGNDACALRLSGTGDYMRIVTRNHLLAVQQCEVIVRHLMLPGHLECCTLPALDWLADHMPTAVVNVMAQYHPEHRAGEYPELRGQVSRRDHEAAVDHARRKGLQLI